MGRRAGGLPVKYVVLALLLAAVLGLCFLVDRGAARLQRWAQGRPVVRLPLRYPILSALLLGAVIPCAWYGIAGKAPMFLEVGGQADLGRQIPTTTPWITERHGYQ